MSAPERRYPDASELTVVIRSAGERTEHHCAELLKSTLPNSSQCVVIHERPFSRAVRASFTIGIESARPWLIAVDADLLLLSDVVCRIREVCGKMAPEAFCATPLFLCNTLGGLATRGLHCYRASMLEEALCVTPNADEPLRPESAIQDAMRERGHTRECYAKVFGLHEYEQSLRHVYIKSMLRARKAKEPELFISRLEPLRAISPDARAALWGFEDATSTSDQPTEYDWDARYPGFDQRMIDAGLSEKPPMVIADTDRYIREHLLRHDFREDTMTLKWIRDLLRFSQGPGETMQYVDHPPLGSSRKAYA